MATLTPEQYQALIVAELGDSAAVQAQIATLWAISTGTGGDAAQYLRTKVRAIDLLLGRTAGQVSFEALDGASVDLSDWFGHLRALRDLVEAELRQAEAAGGGYQIGAIAQTAPVTATAPPDPNDRKLRGDPLRPPRGGFRH